MADSFPASSLLPGFRSCYSGNAMGGGDIRLLPSQEEVLESSFWGLFRVELQEEENQKMAAVAAALATDNHDGFVDAFVISASPHTGGLNMETVHLRT